MFHFVILIDIRTTYITRRKTRVIKILPNDGPGAQVAKEPAGMVSTQFAHNKSILDNPVTSYVRKSLRQLTAPQTLCSQYIFKTPNIPHGHQSW